MCIKSLFSFNSFSISFGASVGEFHNGSSHFCSDRTSIQTCLSLETAGRDVIVKTKTTK